VTARGVRQPRAGAPYRQEYYKGEAEDKAAVITVGEEQVQVPFGYFKDGILMTRDLVPTEPKVQELKFYAPDVGPLLSMHTDGRRPCGARQFHRGSVTQKRGCRPNSPARTARTHAMPPYNAPE